MMIELVAILENTKLAGMGVRDEINVPINIKAELIESYRPYVNDEGNISEDELVVYTITGQQYSVKCTMEEMKKTLKLIE